MHALYFLSILLYIVAVFFQWQHQAKRSVLSVHKRESEAALGLLWSGGIAALLHALILYGIMLNPNGMNFGIFNAASLIMWVIVVILLITQPRQPVHNLMMIMFPMAALVIAMESYFHTERWLDSTPFSGVKLHIITSILAYGLIAISALQALFAAYQNYQLKHKRLSTAMRYLPPLQVMESLLFQTLSVGFIFLTLSLITGFLFLKDIFAQHLVHKTVLSLIAWGVFAGLLWGRWRYGWRGQIAIRWLLIGFVFLGLAYFGSKWVLEIILRR